MNWSEEKNDFFNRLFIYHNTELSSKEVVRKYYEKDIIERAFKKLKGILSLRPIRVCRKEHIEGHLRVCYLSYAVLFLLKYYLNKKKFGFSALELLEKLKKDIKFTLKTQNQAFHGRLLYCWRKSYINFLII